MDAVAKSYANNVTDEFVEPVVCDSEGVISDNDSIIFFNFRPDRAREITRVFVDPEFDGFQREIFPLTYVCTTEYDATMPNVQVAFPRIRVANGLGEYLSTMGMTQLRIAETEKYAHVTFFFNGGVEAVFPGEDRVLVASPKVATYDLQPEMSAVEVTDSCVERIESGNYDVIILNFASERRGERLFLRPDRLPLYSVLWSIESCVLSPFVKMPKRSHGNIFKRGPHWTHLPTGARNGIISSGI